MGGDDDYEFMTPRYFTYFQPVAESCTTGAHFIINYVIGRSWTERASE